MNIMIGVKISGNIKNYCQLRADFEALICKHRIVESYFQLQCSRSAGRKSTE